MLHPHLSHNTIWLYSLYDIVCLVYGNINSTWLMKSHDTATAKICASIFYIQGQDLRDTFIQVTFYILFFIFLHYRKTVCLYMSLLCVCAYGDGKVFCAYSDFAQVR